MTGRKRDDNEKSNSDCTRAGKDDTLSRNTEHLRSIPKSILRQVRNTGADCRGMGRRHQRSVGLGHGSARESGQRRFSVKGIGGGIGAQPPKTPYFSPKIYERVFKNEQAKTLTMPEKSALCEGFFLMRHRGLEPRTT